MQIEYKFNEAGGIMLLDSNQMLFQPSCCRVIIHDNGYIIHINADLYNISYEILQIRRPQRTDPNDFA